MKQIHAFGCSVLPPPGWKGHKQTYLDLGPSDYSYMARKIFGIRRPELFPSIIDTGSKSELVSEFQDCNIFIQQYLAAYLSFRRDLSIISKRLTLDIGL